MIPGLRFNINEMVYFKLTTDGWVRYYELREEEKRRMKLTCTNHAWVDKMYSEYCMKSDSEGYCKMQLWDFMRVFGPKMSCGSKPMINGNDIFFAEGAMKNAPTK